jgi:hypothetical protein
MDDEEIRDLFDQNWNITMSELADITGKTVKELKLILMGK